MRGKRLTHVRKPRTSQNEHFPRIFRTNKKTRSVSPVFSREALKPVYVGYTAGKCSEIQQIFTVCKAIAISRHSDIRLGLVWPGLLRSASVNPVFSSLPRRFFLGLCPPRLDELRSAPRSPLFSLSNETSKCRPRTCYLAAIQSDKAARDNARACAPKRPSAFRNAY